MKLCDRIARLEAAGQTHRTDLKEMTDRELTRLICGDANRILTDEELMEIAMRLRNEQTA